MCRPFTAFREDNKTPAGDWSARTRQRSRWRSSSKASRGDRDSAAHPFSVRYRGKQESSLPSKDAPFAVNRLYGGFGAVPRPYRYRWGYGITEISEVRFELRGEQRRLGVEPDARHIYERSNARAGGSLPGNRAVVDLSGPAPGKDGKGVLHTIRQTKHPRKIVSGTHGKDPERGRRSAAVDRIHNPAESVMDRPVTPNRHDDISFTGSISRQGGRLLRCTRFMDTEGGIRGRHETFDGGTYLGGTSTSRGGVDDECVHPR